MATMKKFNRGNLASIKSNIGMLKTKPGMAYNKKPSSVSEAVLRSYIGRGPGTMVRGTPMDKANLASQQATYDRIKKKNDAAGRRSGPRPV